MNSWSTRPWINSYANSSFDFQSTDNQVPWIAWSSIRIFFSWQPRVQTPTSAYMDTGNTENPCVWNTNTGSAKIIDRKNTEESNAKILEGGPHQKKNVQALWLVQGLNFKQWVVIKEYPNATRHWLIHYSLKVFFSQRLQLSYWTRSLSKNILLRQLKLVLEACLRRSHSKNHHCAFDQLGQTVSKPCVMPKGRVQIIKMEI